MANQPQRRAGERSCPLRRARRWTSGSHLVQRPMPGPLAISKILSSRCADNGKMSRRSFAAQITQAGHVRLSGAARTSRASDLGANRPSMSRQPSTSAFQPKTVTGTANAFRPPRRPPARPRWPTAFLRFTRVAHGDDGDFRRPQRRGKVIVGNSEGSNRSVLRSCITTHICRVNANSLDLPIGTGIALARFG
jgi:hypothetical protein